MNTQSRDYAARVYKQVESFGEKNKDEKSNARKQYGAMAHKLPILVRQAGLLQAMTFVYTRGQPGHTALLSDLAQIVSGDGSEGFLEKCRTDEMSDYIWQTHQTLAALEWFKRFAESVLNIKAGEEGDENE